MVMVAGAQVAEVESRCTASSGLASTPGSRGGGVAAGGAGKDGMPPWTCTCGEEGGADRSGVQ